MDPNRTRAQKGASYVEMLVALMVLAVLASAALPLKRWDEKRRLERYLKMELATMRTAIDEYHRMWEEGLITQDDIDQVGYPASLEELVEGVEIGNPDTGEASVLKLLYRIPIDPITGEQEWGLRSYQDDWDSTSWGGENVYDVYSLATIEALDGTYYSDW